MKNLFVPSEIAELAKKAGFNEPCIFGLSEHGKFHSKLAHGLQGCIINWDKFDTDLPLPLYQQLVDWFLFEYGILIRRAEFNGFEILTQYDGKVINDGWFGTSDEALKQAFTLIPKK